MNEEKVNSINRTRLFLIKKGFVNINDIREFCGCGYSKAKIIYNEILNQVKNEGKNIHPLGIPTYRLLNYLDINENMIIKYANLRFG